MRSYMNYNMNHKREIMDNEGDCYNCCMNYSHPDYLLSLLHLQSLIEKFSNMIHKT